MLQVSRASLTVTGVDMTTQQTAVFNVQNPGNDTLNWTAAVSPGSQNWLSVSPANGSTPAAGNNVPGSTPMTVTCNPTGLVAGAYTGTITLTAGTQTQQVTVTFNIPQQPNLGVSTAALTVAAPPAGPAQSSSITLTNLGNVLLSWSTSITYNKPVYNPPVSNPQPCTQKWLSLSRYSGTLPFGNGQATVLLSCNPAGLQYTGAYSATITFTANGKTQVVTVNFIVQGVNDGMVGFWQCNDPSSTLVDDSPKRNNGTMYGGAQCVAGGHSGLALSLTGRYGTSGQPNCYVSCGASGMPASNTPQTIAWWMDMSKTWSSTNDPQSLTQFAIVLGNTNTALLCGFVYDSTKQTLSVGVWNGKGTCLVSSRPPSMGQWHHFAYTFDGTTHRLYIDGALANSSVVRPLVGTPAGLTLGSCPLSVTLNPYLFNGKLDDIRIYPRTLSAAEVMQVVKQ